MNFFIFDRFLYYGPDSLYDGPDSDSKFSLSLLYLPISLTSLSNMQESRGERRNFQIFHVQTNRKHMGVEFPLRFMVKMKGHDKL